MSEHVNVQSLPSLRLALFRGAIGRCPRCGRAPLFARYLKRVEVCPVCGTRFGHIRADDAAPWLTILLVGHIFLPIVLSLNLLDGMRFWTQMLLWSSVFVLISLFVLPHAKGFFVAVLWLTWAPGSEAR